MKRKAGLLLGIVYFIAVQAAASAQPADAPSVPSISQTFSAGLEADFSRTLGANVYMRGIYDLVLWDLLRFSAGVSFESTPPALDGYFLETGLDNILGTGLWISVKAMGDQYPEYAAAYNSLSPAIGWRYVWVDLAFGITWRFLIVREEALWNMFCYDAVVTEPFFYYRIGGIIPLFDNAWVLGISLSNQNAFFIGNFGTFMLQFANRIRISDNWSVTVDLVIKPAGTVALTANWYEIILRAGARLTL